MSVDGAFGVTTTWFGIAPPGFGQIAVAAANSCRLGRINSPEMAPSAIFKESGLSDAVDSPHTSDPR